MRVKLWLSTDVEETVGEGCGFIPSIWVIWKFRSDGNANVLA